MAQASALALLASVLTYMRMFRRSEPHAELALAPRRILPIPRIPTHVLETTLASESLSRTDDHLCMLCVQLGSSYAHWLKRRFAAVVVAVNPDAELSASDCRQTQAQGLDVVHIRGDGYKFDARDVVEARAFCFVVVDVGEDPSNALLAFVFNALEPGSGVALVQSRYSAALIAAGFDIEKRQGPVEFVHAARAAFRAAVAERRPGYPPPYEPAQSFLFVCRRPVDARPRTQSHKPAVARLTNADGARLRAGCVCTRGKGQVLLVSSSKHRGKWILPGGGVEAGESFETAALREANEEAGVQGRALRLLTLHVTESARTQFVHVAVDHLQSLWQEQWRSRRFVSSTEAMAILGEGASREAVRAAFQPMPS